MGIRLTTKIDKISMKKYYLNIIKDKDKRIAELEQDLEFTTKTANELIEIKHKLEQELAELKEKAIVPRFKYGDKVYYIKYFVGKWQIFDEEYVGENTSNIIVRIMNYYSELPKDSVFATEQEAQAKLKEIQGNE